MHVKKTSEVKKKQKKKTEVTRKKLLTIFD